MGSEEWRVASAEKEKMEKGKMEKGAKSTDKSVCATRLSNSTARHGWCTVPETDPTCKSGMWGTHRDYCRVAGAWSVDAAGAARFLLGRNVTSTGE